jgi:hypothetical protein
MPVTTRRRNLTVKYGHEYGYEIMHYPNGALHSETTWVDADYGGVVGDQLTISEGHPWRSRPKGQNSEDIGGDFFTQKRTCVSGSNAGPQTFLDKLVNDVWTRDSIFRASPYAVSPFTVPWAPYVSSSKADLMKKGTTAIARCSPTNSVADAAVFFGEAFKDGLPSLINPFNWETKLNLLKIWAMNFSIMNSVGFLLLATSVKRLKLLIALTLCLHSLNVIQEETSVGIIASLQPKARRVRFTSQVFTPIGDQTT